MDLSYTVDYLFLGLALLVLVYLLIPPEGMNMASIADLSKHLENMKRANVIVAKAADDAPKHAAIMDSMEKRLTLNSDNMNKLAEYNKLMDAMESLGNGGPVLEETFPSSTTVPASTGTVSNSTIGVGRHGS